MSTLVQFPKAGANGSRAGGPLQRMPFGKYKGLPFSRVPQEYADWLLKQDIDDRLRAALRRTGGFEEPPAPEDNDAMVAAPAGSLTQVVAEFLQAREEAAAAKQRLTELRQRLLPLLDGNGGAYTDAAAGQRVSVEERPRWDYDPMALHRLVEDGALSELQYAECLKTVVDKTVVTQWQEQGLVTIEQLEAAGARVVTRVLRQVCVKPLATS